jgi:hypothetical protein
MSAAFELLRTRTSDIAIAVMIDSKHIWNVGKLPLPGAVTRKTATFKLAAVRISHLTSHDSAGIAEGACNSLDSIREQSNSLDADSRLAGRIFSSPSAARSFIAMYAGARYQFLLSANQHSTHPPVISSRPIFILPPHLYAYIFKVSLNHIFDQNVVGRVFLISPLCAACSTHLIFIKPLKPSGNHVYHIFNNQ